MRGWQWRWGAALRIVDVDGPTHFTTVKAYTVVPYIVLRRRMLVGARQCHAVVSVLWFEWTSLQRNAKRQESYLTGKLKVAMG